MYAVLQKYAYRYKESKPEFKKSIIISAKV